MEQPQETPPVKRSYVIILLSMLLLAVAAILASIPDLTPHRDGIPHVDPSFFDTAPMRKLSAELVTADDSSKCTECHEKGEQIDDIVVGEAGNHEKKLRHGHNDKCFHCHNPKNMDTFQNRDGVAVEYKDVVEMCTNCHGPQYRDWRAGIHGRRLGYFDTKRGEQKSLRCIECHDPHYPVFKPLKPAPGPHALHGRYAGAPAEHPGGITVSASPSQKTTEATPSSTPTPNLKKGDKP